MRAALAVLVGLLLAGFVVSVAWRWTATEDAANAPSDQGHPVATASSGDDRLPIPQSPHERERAEYERARAPFMSSLRAHASSYDCAVEVGDELAELRFIGSDMPPDLVDSLRGVALHLGAERQGFRLISFYERRSPGSGLPPRLVAEVTLRDGRWTTFYR